MVPIAASTGYLIGEAQILNRSAPLPQRILKQQFSKGAGVQAGESIHAGTLSGDRPRQYNGFAIDRERNMPSIDSVAGTKVSDSQAFPCSRPSPSTISSGLVPTVWPSFWVNDVASCNQGHSFSGAASAARESTGWAHRIRAMSSGLQVRDSNFGRVVKLFESQGKTQA